VKGDLRKEDAMKSVKIWLVVGAALVMLGCPIPASTEEKVDTSEVDWAKRVAIEFFKVGMNADFEDYSTSTLGLLPSALATEIKDDRKQGFPPYVEKLIVKYQGGSFQIKSEEVSPSKSEVILTCELIPPSKPNGWQLDKPSDVTVWMAKNSSGVWEVRFIRAKVRKETGK
jgi:hypothetical protein